MLGKRTPLTENLRKPKFVAENEFFGSSNSLFEGFYAFQLYVCIVLMFSVCVFCKDGSHPGACSWSNSNFWQSWHVNQSLRRNNLANLCQEQLAVLFYF